MKNILILVFSSLRNDGRLKRQIGFLTAHHKVTVACINGDNIHDVEILKLPYEPLTKKRRIRLGLLLLFRRYEWAYWELHPYRDWIRRLRSRSFDLIIANDVETLPLAFFGNRTESVILDAHEYGPRQFEDRLWWRLLFKGLIVHVCRKYFPRLSAMTTVGPGLSAEYEKNFGIHPVIVTNAPPFHNLKPSETDPTVIRLVYHGIINRSRNLELLLNIFRHLDDRFTLDMILMTSEHASPSSKRYIEEFKLKAMSLRRVKILPTLPVDQVVPAIHNYDMGVFFLLPVNFNYRHALPNKFFEFIQARLGVAIGPSVEMSPFVRQFEIGVVTDDFNARNIASRLNALTHSQIVKFKEKASIAAAELCAEKNESFFTAIVEKVLTESHQLGS